MAEVTSDADLIAAVRSGNDQAYGQLYRRHRTAALRFARSLADQPADAEDLVADAFTRVLAALRGGNGPNEAFRPYLLSAVRNAFYDHTRRAVREQPVGEMAALAPETPLADPALADDERHLVATAFHELPERWQVVLWHTEVERERPAVVAPLLGISANAVAALAYRAREGLRERYLQAHVGTTTDDQCRRTADRLAGYLRKNLSAAESERVRAHIDGCDNCRMLFVDLADVNSRLGTLLGPIVLGTAAAAYVTGGASAGGWGATALSMLWRVASRTDAQVGAGVLAAAGAVTLTVALVPTPFQTPLDALPSPAPTGPPAVVTTTTAPTTTTPTTITPTTPPVVLSSSSTAAGPDVLSGPPPTSAAPMIARSTAGVATLEPLGPLVRGEPGVLLLTVTIPASSEAPGAGLITAVLFLPSGVTLRAGDPGDGWRCVGAITCLRPNLAPGQTTQAYVPVSVDVAAQAGVPSGRINVPGLASFVVSASRGVATEDARSALLNKLT